MSKDIGQILAEAKKLPPKQQAEHQKWKVRSQFAADMNSKMNAAFDTDEPCFQTSSQFLGTWVVEKIVPCLDQTLDPVITLLSSEKGAHFATSAAQINDDRDKKKRKNLPKLSPNAYFVYKMCTVGLKTPKITRKIDSILQLLLQLNQFKFVTEAFLQLFVTTSAPKTFLNVVTSFHSLLNQFPIDSFPWTSIVKTLPDLFTAAERQNKVRDFGKKIAATLIYKGNSEKIGRYLAQNLTSIQYKDITDLVEQLEKENPRPKDDSNSTTTTNSQDNQVTQPPKSSKSLKSSKKSLKRSKSSKPTTSSSPTIDSSQVAESTQPTLVIRHATAPNPQQNSVKHAQKESKNIAELITWDMISAAEQPDSSYTDKHQTKNRIFALQTIRNMISQNSPVIFNSRILKLFKNVIQPGVLDKNIQVAQAACDIYSVLGQSIDISCPETKKSLVAGDFGFSSIVIRMSQNTDTIAQESLESWKSSILPLIGMEPILCAVESAWPRCVTKTNFPAVIAWFADYLVSLTPWYKTIEDPERAKIYKNRCFGIISNVCASLIQNGNNADSKCVSASTKILKILIAIVGFKKVSSDVLTPLNNSWLNEHMKQFEKQKACFTGMHSSYINSVQSTMNQQSQYDFDSVLEWLECFVQQLEDNVDSIQSPSMVSQAISRLIWLAQSISAFDSRSILLGISETLGEVDDQWNMFVKVFSLQGTTETRLSATITTLIKLGDALGDRLWNNIPILKHILNCFSAIIKGEALDYIDQNGIVVLFETLLIFLNHKNSPTTFHLQKSLRHIYNRLLWDLLSSANQKDILYALVVSLSQIEDSESKITRLSISSEDVHHSVTRLVNEISKTFRWDKLMKHKNIFQPLIQSFLKTYAAQLSAPNAQNSTTLQTARIFKALLMKLNETPENGQLLQDSSSIANLSSLKKKNISNISTNLSYQPSSGRKRRDRKKSLHSSTSTSSRRPLGMVDQNRA